VGRADAMHFASLCVQREISVVLVGMPYGAAQRARFQDAGSPQAGYEGGVAWVSAARGMSCVCCAWPSNLKPRAVQSSSHGTSRAGAPSQLDRDPAADYRGPGCTKYFDAGRLATQVRECGIEVNYMEHIARRYVFLFDSERA
jgi:hypothetical protein